MTDQIIAVREFTYDGSPLRAILHKPIETEKGIWSAKAEVLGLPQPIVENILGGDALQALLLAAQFLRIQLEELGSGLRWRGEELGNTGIPREIGWSYGVSFSKKMERLVERETVKLLQSQARGGAVQSKTAKSPRKRRRRGTS